ncbi:Two-component response regulator ARR2 [Spatholobus suberectus]|nr:Two-component response regulator ARR2 [Spatholobus suberectus]
MDSDKFRSVDLKYICPVPGIKVLVVDGDLTCLATVSEMLRTLRYEVVTASLASEALSIVEEKKNELNLALVDVHLPDMEINALTDKIREISDLPYYLMTADDNLFSTSSELCNGSKLYFKKPIMIFDLSGLWKFAMLKREDGRIARVDVGGFWRLQSQEIIVNNSRECQPFMNTGEQILQSAKREEQELKIGGEQSESLVLKRKRLSWTDDSRTKFLGAVESAQINAPPNQRRQLRNVPGRTKENATNHLQRSHHSLKQANPIQQHRNTHSSDLNSGSQSASQTNNDKRHRPQLHNRQIYLCNCMYLRSLCPPLVAFSISGPSGETLTYGKKQLYPLQDLFGFAHYPSGSGEFTNNGNGEASADIGQVENSTDGKFLVRIHVSTVWMISLNKMKWIFQHC